MSGNARGPVVLFCVLVLIPMASWAQTTITFESDSEGPKPNGFTSADSPIVHFSDSMGANLEVFDSFQSIGNGLEVGSDDPSYLIMDFDVPQTSLSLVFGNDDVSYSSPGDTAVLTLFNGPTQVGEVSVVMNRNDLPDQTISYEGAQFNRATFYYNVTGGGLIEIVDNITFGGAVVLPADVPTASEWALFTLTLALAAAAAFMLRR